MSDAEERVRVALAELGDALLQLARESAVRPEQGAVELLSVADFAKRAGVSRSTAYLLVSSREVCSIKVRGRRLVPASAVAALLDGRR